MLALGLERDATPRGQVDKTRAQRSIRRSFGEQEGRHGRRQVGRRRRHQDRVVVDVHRVAPVSQPGQSGDQHQQDAQQQSAHGDQGVDLPATLQCGGVLRRRVGVDVVETGQQPAVQIAIGEEGLHVVVEDGLAIRVTQESGPVAAAGIE